MVNTHDTGKKAENIAAEFLANMGYRILHRNWRYYHKEIDIVAWHNNTLVIVEVKSRIGNFGEPVAEAVGFGKMRHLVNAAEAYIQRFNIDAGTRFDIVGVNFFGEEHTISHIEGAFIPGVNW